MEVVTHYLGEVAKVEQKNASLEAQVQVKDKQIAMLRKFVEGVRDNLRCKPAMIPRVRVDAARAINDVTQLELGESYEGGENESPD